MAHNVKIAKSHILLKEEFVLVIMGHMMIIQLANHVLHIAKFAQMVHSVRHAWNHLLLMRKECAFVSKEHIQMAKHA